MDFLYFCDDNLMSNQNR